MSCTLAKSDQGTTHVCGKKPTSLTLIAQRKADKTGQGSQQKFGRVHKCCI